MFEKVTIILTTTVHVTKENSFQHDKEERINCYIKAIMSWLNNTYFNIVVVENSGYPFLELSSKLIEFADRLEVISFIPEYPPSLYFLPHSKGWEELFSICHAFEKSNVARHSLFILKITGRFFIPDLVYFLSNHDLNAVCALRQNENDRCEIVGTHILYFHHVFNFTSLINENGDLEYHVEYIYRYRLSSMPNVLQCPNFSIEPTQRGGVDEIYYTL